MPRKKKTTRTINVAAVQMDAAPAPLAERLSRAADLVAEASNAGAQLVVLPELFNSGYEYSDRNYALAEPIDGETVTWMKEIVHQYDIHLVGSLMLRDFEDVYNSALLIAPDGRTWRYDKNYPFNWERAYFREGRQITVADTDLGKFGMMICWDSAHPEQWARYAGKVDAMLIASCPPRLASADLVFPDGMRLSTQEVMRTHFGVREGDDFYFYGPDMNRNAAWLGVPVIYSQAAGKFRSKLPLPTISVGSSLGLRPDLWGRLSQAAEVEMEARFDSSATRIIDSAGQDVSCVQSAGDGFTIGEVVLSDDLAQPQTIQPAMHTPTSLRFFIDVIGTSLMTPLYRRGVRQEWGDQMAPVDPRTKVWLGAVLVAALIGAWLGGMGRPRIVVRTGKNRK